MYCIWTVSNAKTFKARRSSWECTHKIMIFKCYHSSFALKLPTKEVFFPGAEKKSHVVSYSMSGKDLTRQIWKMQWIFYVDGSIPPLITNLGGYCIFTRVIISLFFSLTNTPAVWGQYRLWKQLRAVFSWSWWVGTSMPFTPRCPYVPCWRSPSTITTGTSTLPWVSPQSLAYYFKFRHLLSEEAL